MPELPEVETVKRGLNKILEKDNVIQSVEIKTAKLRFDIPKNLARKLKGQKILKVERRAKYLLFYLEQGILINHLGMTGTWRKDLGDPAKKHDHLILHFKTQNLIFNDPRRFGYVDLLPEKNWQKNKWFSHLGPEPFAEDFDVDYLLLIFKKKSAPVKTVIMDQAIVVGVGNIYAAESLFMSKIKPHRPANKITRIEAELLIQNIRIVLEKAILAGGSSIKDFLDAEGNASYFQHQFLVYGKQGVPCPTCGKALKNKTLGGRASVYCSYCQK